MEQLIVIAAHVPKVIEVDWLEAIVENFHASFLREISKMEGKALNLLGDLTYNIILISQSLESLACGRVGYESWGSGDYGGGNANVGFLLHAFKLECILPSSSSLFIFSFLARDLIDLQVLLL